MKKSLCFALLMAFSTQSHAGFAEGEKFFNAQNYTSAFAEFFPLAENGDFRSQYYVGYQYLNGLGVTQNVDEALKFLKSSSDQGFDMAQAQMAFLYAEGELLPKDLDRAVVLYQKAAAQYNASANLNLGVMYYNGDGVPVDYKKALECFKKVPISFNPLVSRYLGEIYLNQPSLRDYAQALSYYKISAQKGDLSSFFNIGEIYRKGLGVDANPSEAMTYHRYAASKGYAPSQYMVGLMYVNGEGVSRNINKAYAWLTMASEQNFEIASQALQQISVNMSLSDVEKARREIVMLQSTEMGKVESPLVEVAALPIQGSSVSSNEDAKRRIRRIKRGRRAVRKPSGSN